MIYGMRERDRTQLTQKDTWNEREIEPNLLKMIYGMSERDRTLLLKYFIKPTETFIHL